MGAKHFKFDGLFNKIHSIVFASVIDLRSFLQTAGLFDSLLNAIQNLPRSYLTVKDARGLSRESLGRWTVSYECALFLYRRVEKYRAGHTKMIDFNYSFYSVRHYFGM